MRIKSIKLENFRGFEKACIDFDGNSTVLFGINGSGKSSILRAMDLIFADIIRKVTESKKALAIMEVDDIFDSRAFSKIDVEFSIDNKNISIMRRINRDGARISDQKSLVEFTDLFSRLYLADPVKEEDPAKDWKTNSKEMPIFVNYGVNRLVGEKSLEYKDQEYRQLNAFDNAIDNKIDFVSFFSWFRKREDIENQLIATTRKAGIDRLISDPILDAVRKAMLSMFPNFENVRCERKNNTLVLEKDGNVLNINQLSDGEKCTLALFGDIARRLAIANESVLIDSLHGQGVVLIDEIDLHLHPEWQRKIMGILRNTFPNIQFIITTHSPQVLGDIPADMKIFAVRNEDGKAIVERRKSLLGWDSNIILEEEMHTVSMSAGVKKLVDEMYSAYDAGDYDLTLELANKIDDITDGHNNSVSGIRVMVSRKRRSNA